MVAAEVEETARPRAPGGQLRQDSETEPRGELQETIPWIWREG